MWQCQSPWKWPKEASVKVQTQLQRRILEPRGLWADYPERHQVWGGAARAYKGNCVCCGGRAREVWLLKPFRAQEIMSETQRCTLGYLH